MDSFFFREIYTAYYEKQYKPIFLKEEIIMKEITKQYVKEVNEVKKSLFDMMGDANIQHMDIETFKFLQTALKLIDTSNQMVMESGQIMDEMNAKIDLLLKK